MVPQRLRCPPAAADRASRSLPISGDRQGRDLAPWQTRKAVRPILILSPPEATHTPDPVSHFLRGHRRYGRNTDWHATPLSRNAESSASRDRAPRRIGGARRRCAMSRGRSAQRCVQSRWGGERNAPHAGCAIAYPREMPEGHAPRRPLQRGQPQFPRGHMRHRLGLCTPPRDTNTGANPRRDAFGPHPTSPGGAQRHRRLTRFALAAIPFDRKRRPASANCGVQSEGGYRLRRARRHKGPKCPSHAE